MTQKFANAARAELLSLINDTDTIIEIDGGGSEFPVANTGSAAISNSADWFKAVLQDDTGIEIVYVRTHTSGSTTFSNVIRGQEGTTARSFAAGSVFGIRPTAGDSSTFEAKQPAAVTSSSPPSNPSSGQVWIDIDDGTEYTWLEDGTSGQWVELGPGGTSDADYVLNRANHTGTQGMATVDGLSAALDDKFDKSGGAISGRAYTSPSSPSHSATPTFNCAEANYIEPGSLTSNITSMTLSNPTGGQTLQIRFVQDGVGGRTVALPAGAKVDGSIASGANRVSHLIMTYSAAASRWEGNWLQIPE